MPGYTYLSHLSRSENEQESLSESILATIDKHEQYTGVKLKYISIIVRQPIDEDINQFIDDPKTQEWLTEALGDKKIIILEKKPSQRWVEQVISIFQIPRNNIPAILFVGVSDSLISPVLCWSLIYEKKHLKDMLTDIIITMEKIESSTSRWKIWVTLVYLRLFRGLKSNILPIAKSAIPNMIKTLSSVNNGN